MNVIALINEKYFKYFAFFPLAIFWTDLGKHENAWECSPAFPITTDVADAPKSFSLHKHSTFSVFVLCKVCVMCLAGSGGWRGERRDVMSWCLSHFSVDLWLGCCQAHCCFAIVTLHTHSLQGIYTMPLNHSPVFPLLHVLPSPCPTAENLAFVLKEWNKSVFYTCSVIWNVQAQDHTYISPHIVTIMFLVSTVLAAFLKLFFWLLYLITEIFAEERLNGKLCLC